MFNLYGFGLNALLGHLFKFYVNRNIEYLDYFYMREYIQEKYGKEEVKKGGIIEKFTNAIWNNCINLNISEMLEQYKIINKKHNYPMGQFKMNLNEEIYSEVEELQKVTYLINGIEFFWPDICILQRQHTSIGCVDACGRYDRETRKYREIFAKGEERLEK